MPTPNSDVSLAAPISLSTAPRSRRTREPDQEGEGRRRRVRGGLSCLRERKPKTLIVWGKGDPIVLSAGATPFEADLPDPEIHLLNSGHFALKEDAAEIARQIMRKFAR